MDEDSETNVEPCEHEWGFQDDSFDHEFGTEVIYYWLCENCGETREYTAEDDEDWYDV